MKRLYEWFLRGYKNQSLEIVKKSRILLTTNLFIGAFGLLLTVLMFATGAVVVSALTLILCVFCFIAVMLIRAKRYRFASNFFLAFLFAVIFLAIKFDQYKNVYEVYVLGTMGMLTLVASCLVGYHVFQPITITVLNSLQIFAIYFLDTFPQSGYKMSALDIQSLAASLVFVIVAGILGVLIMSLQKALLAKAEKDNDLTRQSYNRLDEFFHSAQSSGLEIGKRLTDSSEKSLRIIEEVIAYMQSIRAAIGNLYESIRSASEANGSLIDSSNLVQSTMNEYRGVVELATASVNKIIGSLKEISNEASRQTEALALIVETTAVGEKKMEQSEAAIKRISDSVSQMLNMLSLINDVAERTNMLALNAAIEASHAGESGKGFAVVASEIRNLSEETRANTQKMSNDLKKNIADITYSSATSKEAGVVFNQINTQVNDTAALIGNMLEGLKMISGEADEVISAVNRISELSEPVNRSLGVAAESLNESSTHIGKISELSDGVRTQVEKVSDYFDNMRREAEAVNVIGRENIDHIRSIYQGADSLNDNSTQSARTH